MTVTGCETDEGGMNAITSTMTRISADTSFAGRESLAALREADTEQNRGTRDTIPISSSIQKSPMKGLLLPRWTSQHPHPPSSSISSSSSTSSSSSSTSILPPPCSPISSSSSSSSSTAASCISPLLNGTGIGTRIALNSVVTVDGGEGSNSSTSHYQSERTTAAVNIRRDACIFKVYDDCRQDSLVIQASLAISFFYFYPHMTASDTSLILCLLHSSTIRLFTF